MEWDLLVRVAAKYHLDEDSGSDVSADTDSDSELEQDMRNLLLVREAANREPERSPLMLPRESALDTIYEDVTDFELDGVVPGVALFGAAKAKDPGGRDDESQFEELLNRAVSAYWKHTQAFLPLIHRGAFEAAMREGRTAVYEKRPTALLYGLASNAVRHLSDVDPGRKGAFIRWCLEKSSNATESGAFGGDLGNLQALVLMCQTLILSGLGSRLFPLSRRAAEEVDALYKGLESLGTPQTADLWIYREMVLRLYIVSAGQDTGQAHASLRPSTVTYFHVGRMPLPASEFNFEHENPDAAFHALRATSPDGSFPFVDIPGVGWSDVAQVVKAVSEGVLFTSKFSTLALFHFSTILRSQLIALQRNARQYPTPLDLPSIREDVTFLASIAKTPSSTFSERGLDINSLFEASSVLIPRLELRQSAAQGILAMDGHAIEGLMLGGFRNSAIDRAVQTAALLEAHLRMDDVLRHGHFIMLAPIFGAGKLLLEALNDLQTDNTLKVSFHPKDIERSVRTCARALHALGNNYGMQARKLSERFQSMMAQAGVVDDDGSSTLACS